METMGKRIMQNRKRLGLTQDQLAEKLGVTAQAVSKWENDQSCPDISVLPQLADIFGISTDELLGREPETKVHQGEVVQEDCGEPHRGNFEMYWDSGRKSALCFAVQVLGVGALYLTAILSGWDISFWSILWTTSLLVYGLFGLYPRFSFFRLGCALVGGYSLAIRLFPPMAPLRAGAVLAVSILLFGVSLLCDALKKPKKHKFNVTYTDHMGRTHTGRQTNNYESSDSRFQFDGCFGSNRQRVELQTLERGKIDVSFGEFTVDLSGVGELARDACVEADCSFGELTILVPGRFQVNPDSSTAMAEFSVHGQPDDIVSGQLRLVSSVSFGEITVRYI